MKVSVIVAAYNIENYIERCLVSIVNQTLEDIEIIVVNDGSIDKTLEVIKKVANYDDRIKIINQDNKGSIEARKSGLDICQGEYILFVDGDDYLELDALYKLYNKASREKLDIVLYDAYCSFDHKITYLHTFNKNINVCENLIKNLFLGNIMPGMAFKLVRKKYIDENNIEFPKSISFAEDLASVTAWFIHEPKVSIIDEPLYNYYQRENSMVRSISKSILDVDEAISFIKHQLIKHNIYEKYKLEFEYLIYNHLLIYRIIACDKLENLHKKVYKQYKNRKINIYTNPYIKEEIYNSKLSYKIRLICYNYNYYIGNIYDYLRKKIKK